MQKEMSGVTTRARLRATSDPALMVVRFTIAAVAWTVTVTVGRILKRRHHRIHTVGPTTLPAVTIHGSMMRAIPAPQVNIVRICSPGLLTTPLQRTYVALVATSNGVTEMVMATVTTTHTMLGTVTHSRWMEPNTQIQMQTDMGITQTATMPMIVQ